MSDSRYPAQIEREAGLPFTDVRDTLRRARELPWDAGSEERWRQGFNELITRALAIARLLRDRLESREVTFRPAPGLLLGDLLREQESLIASLEALAADTAHPRDVEVAEYVALHERTVILESDIVRLEARLGGGQAHDPRTLVGAACRLPGVTLGI